MSRYVNIEPYDDCKIVLHKEDEGIRCRDLPTADVVEVVRCKNCKHFRFSDFSDMYGECSQAHIRLVSPYSFCSYGERKDEE